MMLQVVKRNVKLRYKTFQSSRSEIKIIAKCVSCKGKSKYV